MDIKSHLLVLGGPTDLLYSGIRENVFLSDRGKYVGIHSHDTMQP
jgi:hypothetical protein